MVFCHKAIQKGKHTMSLIVRPYAPGEEEYVALIHEKVYSEEYNWGSAFTSYAMKIARQFKPKENEQLWIAEFGGKPVGSIMLCEADSIQTAQLRLFIVEKPFRGLGIGRALTDTLLDFAKSNEYKKIVLWTASPLTDAIRQYDKLGFIETERTENTSWSLSGDIVYEIKMEKQL